MFVLLFLVLCLGLIYKALPLWGLDARSWRGAGFGTLLAGLMAIVVCGVGVFTLIRDARRAAPFLLGAFLLIEGVQISTWLLQPTYTLKAANESIAGALRREDTIVTYYETVMLSSAAKVICRSVRRGLNVDVFETSSPEYILVLRRDNWKDYALEGMPPEEWPPPAGFLPEKAAGFDLCPTRLRGPRFIVELYSLSPRMKRRKNPPPSSLNNLLNELNEGLPGRRQKYNLTTDQDFESQQESTKRHG